jgi:serine/threonine-protein kinase
VIGRYAIRRELGRGMMGVVYEAHDPVLGRDIALKVIQGALGATEEERQRFEQRFFVEARAAARLTHPGIIVVHDVGRDADSGALYMALELLRGRALDGVLREQRRLEWREALRIARRVAEALHQAHTQGVVHRDIKPANIMLLDRGEPKIMDFGIARVEASELTATGQFLGTPLYMSPEQALAHPVDARSDIFSLGAVLYEMVTGRHAFGGESVTKILFQIVSREPDPASRLVPGLPPAVDYALARCLAKDAGARYPDARTLAEDVEDILAGRSPRGQVQWQRPSASGTVVGPPPGGAPASPAVSGRGQSVAVQAPAAPPWPRHDTLAPQKRRAVALGVGIAVLGTVLLGSILLWKSNDRVAWRPTEPARSSQDPGRASTPERDATAPASAEETRPAPDARRVVPPDRDAAAPASDEESAAKRPDQPGSTGPAHLALTFEHSLKAGVLRVWVDDQPVIEEPFGGRVTREIGGIKLRKGRLSDALELRPGRREVRVQVSWEGNTKTERIFTNFKPGGSYRLKARMGSLGGLRKDLSLEWE